MATISTTAPNAAPIDARIRQCLADELAALEQFHGLLLSEQSVLQSGDADKLLPISDKKSALAERLGTLLKARELALTQAGFTGNREGMERWITMTPTQPDSLGKQWARLLELATTARTQQDVNGKLIAIQMQHTQQALAALMSASGRPLTYGPDGQQRLGGGGRALGSA